MRRPPIVWTIVVGGGSGSRFGRLKQYELIGDERIIDRSRRTAAQVSDGVVVVVPFEDAEREGATAGGATRSDSVRAGLADVPEGCDVICVHDAARPLASVDLFRAVIDAIVPGVDGAVPGLPVSDTIKVVDRSGAVVATPERSALRAVQTPQAFRATVLRDAHAGGADSTDDASLVELAGGRVVVVAGEPTNRKVTHPDDLAWVRSAVMSAERIGSDQP